MQAKRKTKNSEDKQEESEPYLIEKIVKKRFRSGVATDNTWELPSNVPDNIQSAFEANNPRPRCQGLRKVVYRDDEHVVHKLCIIIT